MARGYSLSIVILVLVVLIDFLLTSLATLFGTVCESTIHGIPDYRAGHALLLGNSAQDPPGGH